MNPSQNAKNQSNLRCSIRWKIWRILEIRFLRNTVNHKDLAHFRIKRLDEYLLIVDVQMVSFVNMLGPRNSHTVHEGDTVQEEQA